MDTQDYTTEHRKGQAVMNISRAMAYQLMHREDFPTIVIGKRMVVPRDKFLEWLEESVGKR